MDVVQRGLVRVFTRLTIGITEDVVVTAVVTDSLVGDSQHPKLDLRCIHILTASDYSLLIELANYRTLERLMNVVVDSTQTVTVSTHVRDMAKLTLN